MCIDYFKNGKKSIKIGVVGIVDNPPQSHRDHGGSVREGEIRKLHVHDVPAPIIHTT